MRVLVLPSCGGEYIEMSRSLCVCVCMNVYVSVCFDLFADLGVWGCAWEIGRLGRCVCVIGLRMPNFLVG